MKKYRLHLSVLFLFSFLNCYSNLNPTDTTKNKADRFRFSFDFGTQYHSLLHDNYFPLDTFQFKREIVTSDNYERGGRVGRIYIPTLGFYSTFIFNYSFKKRFNIESGLQLSFRQGKYNMNDDTVERNIVNDFNIHNFLPVDTFKSINNSSFNIVVPIYCGYSIKRFSGYVGAKISTLTFSREHWTSMNDYEINYYNSYGIFDIEIFPSIKIKYLLLNKKINVSSYFEIDKRYWKFYDFLIGFEIKFYSLK